jgi:hypothetical protein
VRNVLVEFFRCPANLLELPTPGDVDLPQIDPNHFAQAVSSRFPADLSGIVDYLRLERYSGPKVTGTGALLASEAARWLYYQIRPALPDSLRRTLQRAFLGDWNQLPFPRWPVDTTVEDLLEKQLLLALKISGLDAVPFIWFWPDGAPSAAMVTHDVEARDGLARVPDLIDVDDAFGVKASFQLVPEQRYSVSGDLLEAIRQRKCEVNVHSLNHDGNLFRDRESFLQQCTRINHYVREFGAEGFRSACMYRNVDWLEDLNISYDMSVPNVAHLEPQRGGCCTVFPYFIGEILELPLTAVQDYSLFHIIGDYSIDLWKRQSDLVAEKHGLLSFIIHPDYVFAEKSLRVYRDLLAFLSLLRDERDVWIARPGDVNRWWRQRSRMTLMFEDGMWRVEGPGKERARVGFASIEDDRIVYKLGQKACAVNEVERACLS